MTVPESAQDLANKIWKTYSSRFNASRRLRNNYWIYLITTNFATLGILIFSVLPKFGFSFSVSTGVVDAIVILYSGLLLVLSLLFTIFNFQMRSERHHESGMLLDALYREIKYSSGITPGHISDWLKRYDDILLRYENHEPVDFDWLRMVKRNEFQEFTLRDFPLLFLRINWHRVAVVVLVFSPLFSLIWILHSPT